ncbi:unnamed protein product [Lymnaea stagnalis]|uniref:Uncharacterized protein n=1 Tax=Lymnaea stagnalis TaxID=6523 RepID=A0AAV2H4G4_LYMST
MNHSVVQGTLLVCMVLGIQVTVSYYSVTFQYNCQNLWGFHQCSPWMLWFSKNMLTNFRDCLCSASTTECHAHSSYHHGYDQANQIGPRTSDEQATAVPLFTCKLEFHSNTFRCNRTSAGSDNATKAFQFTGEAKACPFMCVGLILTNIDRISIENNNIMSYFDSLATCPLISGIIKTTEMLTTQPPTTRNEHSTASSTITTALFSTVASSKELSGYNHSGENTPELRDGGDIQDQMTDIGLITGATTAIVAAIVIALVVVFLLRRRMKKISHTKFPQINNFSSNHPTVSDPKATTFF